MTFGKPSDKNIDWNIWKPIIPVKLQKYLNIIILVVGVLIFIPTILILRQEIYSSVVYNVVFDRIIYHFFPDATKVFVIALSIMIRLLYVFTIIFLHEFLHIVCYPQYGYANTYIFFDRQIGAVCPIYDGEISRNRRLLSNAMPIMILSCGIYLLSFIANHDLRIILRITALINFVLSYVDIMGLFLILRLPTKATLYLGVWRE